MIDIEKLSSDKKHWGAVAPDKATHYDPDFKSGPAWRRIEEDGRWLGKHPDGGWYCFSPTPEQVEKYIERPH